MKKFYAVQHGNNYDWDSGSTRWREALVMAHALMRDHDFDGEEIRIAIIDTKWAVCDKEIVIRDGEC